MLLWYYCSYWWTAYWLALFMPPYLEDEIDLAPNVREFLEGL